jgi:large subunit ribosomal protein L18
MKVVEKRQIRKKRIKKKVRGTAERPRVSVFRSNKHLYVQAIDDVKGETLASFCDLNLKQKKAGNKTEIAKLVGAEFGKLLKKKGVETCVFDRSGYQYFGRVAALAEGIREQKVVF